MKRIFLILFIFALAAVSTSAQSKKTPVRKKPQITSKVVSKAAKNVQKHDGKIMLLYKFDENYELCIDSINGSEYYVIPFPGKTAKELYSMVYSNVAYVYAHPDKVISGLPGEYMIINGYADKVYSATVPRGLQYLNFMYRIDIRFKNGRIRVNIPHIEDFFFGVEDDEQFHKNDRYGRNAYFSVNPEAIESVLFNIDYIANILIYGDLNKMDKKEQDDW